MAVKKINVSTKHKDEKIEEMAHFGYKAITVMNMGKKTSITFARDLSKDDKPLLHMEKEYNRVSRPIPYAAIGVLVGAIVLLLVYKFVPIHPVIDVAILASSIVCFAISIFFFAIFIAVKFYRKKIVEKLFLRGDRFQGIVRDIPVSKNIEAANDLSCMIQKDIKHVLENNEK